MRKRKCKHCKEWFEPKRSNQIVCSPTCAYEHSKKRGWKKRKKELKEKVKTRSDHMKEAQHYFNRYIRLRDEDKPCISCGTNSGKMNAGHYKSVGAHPELRFNEKNVHKQCEHCNSYLSGNIINYRKNLIKRIGFDIVDWLEEEHEPLKLSVDEIKGIKEKYKKLCKLKLW